MTPRGEAGAADRAPLRSGQGGVSLGAGGPDIQLAAVGHGEHLECRALEGVCVSRALVGDGEDSVGEALAGGVHLGGVTLKVVSDFSPGGVERLVDDRQRLWAVARGRYQRARLHGASLFDRVVGTVPGSWDLVGHLDYGWASSG